MARTNLAPVRPPAHQKRGYSKARVGKISGKPKRPQEPGTSKTERKPPSYYIERRKQHAAAGRTLPKSAENTKLLEQSVMGKWERYCSYIGEEPKALLRDLKAEDVKAYFDWIEEHFQGSIEAHSSLGTYWRTLKRLRYLETGKVMDDSMRIDCLNYKNVVSERMGLRTLPKPKPVAAVDDLCYFQVVHLVWCDAVFPDEKQRFDMFPGLNLSSISGCRAVSLFDTRGKKAIADVEYVTDPEADGDTDSGDDDVLADSDLEDDLCTDSDRTLIDGGVDDRIPDGTDWSTSSVDLEDCDASSGGTSDPEDSDTDDIDADWPSETESDVDSDVGMESDASSVTDDGYLAGSEETRTIIWRHIAFYIIRSPVPGRPNIPFAIVTLLHTKGEDRKPRTKRFVIEHEYNPLFDLLGQLLAMAIHDHIFVADIDDIEQIYNAEIPYHKRGMQLKIKRDKLDLPIFRQPERSDKGHRTSDKLPLKARMWSRNVKRLGLKGGLEENLTQKVMRRGTINEINNKAPSSVRDQIADHESNAVKYYLNEIVNFDTAAAFLQRPSNEAVQKEARLVTLMADMTAPTGLTDQQKARIQNDPRIRRKVDKCQRLKDKIKKRGYRTIKAAQGTALYERKKQADDDLNRERTRLREKLKKKARKRHFRSNDTMIFNQQFRKDPLPKSQKPVPCLTPPVYQIRERAALVKLICRSKPDLTVEEEHARRLKCIRLWIGWQDRQESPRRGAFASASKHQQEPELPEEEMIPEKCHPLQCPICLGNSALPYRQRTKKFSKVNKMWDHVDGIHRVELAAYDTGKKACLICKAREKTFFPSSVRHFKNHTHSVHRIPLRA